MVMSDWSYCWYSGLVLAGKRFGGESVEYWLGKGDLLNGWLRSVWQPS